MITDLFNIFAPVVPVMARDYRGDDRRILDKETLQCSFFSFTSVSNLYPLVVVWFLSQTAIIQEKYNIVKIIVIRL